MSPILTKFESLLQIGREHLLAELRRYLVADLHKLTEFTIKLFSEVANNAKVEDEPLLDILAQFSIEVVNDFGLDKSAIILTDYSFYQEQIGNFRKGIKIGLVAVEFSMKHGDINLRRRAHSVLGSHFIRICDFQMACHHLEIALRLARNLENPLFECAVLSNIAVLFNGMGLNRDSAKVALKALSYPGNTPQLATLQAFNAVNIMKSSRLIYDNETSDHSYRMACKKVKRRNLQTNKLLIAYFEFNRALYLIDRGKRDVAIKYIDDALLEHSATNNPRVDALLQTAKALCAFASRRPADIRKAKQTLKGILKATREYRTHHEDTLRALIQVYAAEKTFQGRKASLGYAQQLRQYVLEERRVSFSFQIGDGSKNEDPYFGHIFGNLTELEWPLGCSKTVPLSVRTEFTEIYLNLAKVRASASQGRFDTGAYSIAENWALAAEFSVNGSGRHCFQVGKLAGAIAAGLGIEMGRCVEIELACRLHDIGKIATNETMLQGAREYLTEDHISVREHTGAGAQLLNCSTDPILRLAAIVAKHHHEWWNGCGFPDGLRGGAIPLEARICAIADTYDSFTNPTSGQVAWTHKEAVQQICAMGGVQLDPSLISPFLEAVGADAAASERVAEAVNQSMERNQLVRAKKKLFETLELVD